MPETKDQTVGTTETVRDDSPKGVGTPADGSAGSPAVTESPEELKARVTKLEAEKQELLSQRTNVEEKSRKADAALEQARLEREQRERAAQQPPNNAAMGDLDPNHPLVQQAFALEQFRQNALSIGDNAQAALIASQQQTLVYQYRREAEEQRRGEAWRKAEAELSGVPAELRDRTRQKWMSGGYRTVADALLAVRGEDKAQQDSEVERLRRENEELRKDKEARERPPRSAGPAGISGSASFDDGPQTLAEYRDGYDKLMASKKKDEAIAWVKKYGTRNFPR